MWIQNCWQVSTTVHKMQGWHSVSCKMATLLNELTRDKVHTNNPIPVGTKHGTYEHPQTMWLSIVQTYLSPNKCSNGAATADI